MAAPALPHLRAVSGVNLDGSLNFNPLPARAEDLERLAGRVTALEGRLADMDAGQFGSTAWLIREARTVVLMTPNEGLAHLRQVLRYYDRRRRAIEAEDGGS